MHPFIAILLALPTLAWASEPSLSRQAIDTALSAYEEKLVVCEQREEERSSPDSAVLQALEDYPPDAIRQFLIAQSALSLRACTMPELGRVSFLIGAILESPDVSKSDKTYVQQKGSLVHGSSWGFHQHLHAVPEGMKQNLATFNYFDKPFDAMKILDQLGIF